MQISIFTKNSLKYLLLSFSKFIPAKTIPILLYHSIDNSKTEDSVSPEMFSNQMEYIYNRGYRVLSLEEIDHYLDTCDNVPSNIVVITFDDGYHTVCEFAMPILRKYNFTASVFLPTKYIGKCSEWTEPIAPLLTWEEILEMKKEGISFYSHSHSHSDLTLLTEEQVREELEMSKGILEEKLQNPVFYIAYPFSKSNKIIENVALKCGYRRSFSVIDVKKRRMRSGCFVVLRRSVIKKDNMLAFKFVLANNYHSYFDLKKLAYLSKCSYTGYNIHINK